MVKHCLAHVSNFLRRIPAQQTDAMEDAGKKAGKRGAQSLREGCRQARRSAAWRETLRRSAARGKRRVASLQGMWPAGGTEGMLGKKITS